MPAGAIFQLICSNCVIFRHKDDENKLHKIDGPAKIREYCKSSWYFHGIKIKRNMIKHHEKLIKYKKKYEKALEFNELLNNILNNMILDNDNYYKIRKNVIDDIIASPVQRSEN